LAVASVESGGRLPAAGASAAARAGRPAGRSCLPLLLACKASRSQLARPLFYHFAASAAVEVAVGWVVVVVDGSKFAVLNRSTVTLAQASKGSM